MSRTHRRILALCTIIAFALSASLVVAQYDKGDKKMPAPGTPEAAKMQKEMEEQMMQMGQPGPEHKDMAKGAGKYDAEVKFLDMATGQWSPPMKGTMNMEPIMDGRYMMMKYEGTMTMGDGQSMPFKGLGIMGYDNVKKKYFSTWIDSMSTGLMKSEGTKEGNTLTMLGSMPDPSGTEMKTREVITHTDDDHMSYDMYCSMMGKEMKMMEIRYTRKK